MENFDKKRFGLYAKYDLAINKVLYRNLALVIFGAFLSIILFSFLIRYSMFLGGSSIEDYSNIDITCLFLIGLIDIAICVCAGFTLHPLRNKRGRITHFTIPATCLEKYLWHVLICVVGCIVVSLISIVICDGINAILSLIFIDEVDLSSYFYTFIAPLSDLSMPNAGHFNNAVTASSSIWYFALSVTLTLICGMFLDSAFYAFGNSIKYKYNIPLTYIALQVLKFILSILLLIVVYVLENYDVMSNLKSWHNELGAMQSISYILFSTAGISLILGCGLWYYSYQLYKKAQICNAINK